MNRKICTGCKAEKPWSEFHPTKLGTPRPRCKQCEAERQRNLPPAKKREYANRWRDNNRETFRLIDRRCRKRRTDHYVPDPVKARARRKVRAAVESGDLIKPNHCQRCYTNGGVQAHHVDYSKPLKIEWLCSLCHGRESRKYEKPEQRCRAFVAVMEASVPSSDAGAKD